MPDPSQTPWAPVPRATGPGESLRHGLTLLQADSDTNRRLAMISIDDAVELMIKTYLGLPKRITNLTIPRKEFSEIAESFPALLDALERYAPDKLDGIDLGTIEWYHRLRNELYHQGNGLTVERDKVDIYAELANVLYANLFGVRLVPHATPRTHLLGEFIQSWVLLERELSTLVERERDREHADKSQPRTVIEAVRLLADSGVFSRSEVGEINEFRQIRNQVLHGGSDYRGLVTSAVVSQLKDLASKIPGTAVELGKPFAGRQ